MLDLTNWHPALLVLANRPTDDAPTVLDLTNGCPAAGLGAQYLLWLAYKVVALEFFPVAVMCGDGILFHLFTFTVLTVLTMERRLRQTSVLVSHSSVFATRLTVPLVEESRVAFPEDEVASLDYAYGVASLDDGVASLKDDGVASLKDDGVASLGDDSTDERAISPSLMARIKLVEDWRPPKEYFLSLGAVSTAPLSFSGASHFTVNLNF